MTGAGLAGAFASLVAGPLGLNARYGPVPAGRAAASADSDAYEFAMVATGRPYPVPYTTGAFAGWRDHELRGVVNDGNAAHALDGVSGHAGLFATVADLLTLGAALRAGDLGGRAVLERFAAPSAVAPDRALGFRRRVLRPIRRRAADAAVPRRVHRHLLRLRAGARARHRRRRDAPVRHRRADPRQRAGRGGRAGSGGRRWPTAPTSMTFCWTARAAC